VSLRDAALATLKGRTWADGQNGILAGEKVIEVYTAIDTASNRGRLSCAAEPLPSGSGSWRGRRLRRLSGRPWPARCGTWPGPELPALRGERTVYFTAGTLAALGRKSTPLYDGKPKAEGRR
jgi:hypothetical protein